MKTWLPPVEIVISDGVSIKLTRATQHAPSLQITPVTVIDESYKICKSASRVGRGVGVKPRVGRGVGVKRRVTLFRLNSPTVVRPPLIKLRAGTRAHHGFKIINTVL